MQQLEESIARYLADLDRADRDPSTVTEARVEHLKEKVETVLAQMQRLKHLGEQMSQTPDVQISLTDPQPAPWPPVPEVPGWSVTTFRLRWMPSITWS